MANAKRPSAPRVPRQGTAAQPHIAPPRTSGKPKMAEPAQTPQTKRGFHSPGTHGTNRGAH